MLSIVWVQIPHPAPNYMINIVVYSHTFVDIEDKSFKIESKSDMTIFIYELMQKVKYSGERICLETAEIDSIKGKSNFTEIDRW